ncbi:helix-turn-helix domain-containing protein [Apilactobacillus ozensis]|uniref:helix-turn-helix domain-containing protein n=1 Tax=Apilactobacillus ozensis TaxID=866801 RepID=UPI00200B4F5D|nr:helix-turn-helix transcriptional regulator [Apilactobacillus ozensis]MCK8606988.1 helix-turn-helix transcriptional regulator [Apilactobacillus ozensis]
MYNRLREVRTAKGISLANLADELKAKENFSISGDALAKYERGVREPKLSTWNILAHYFQVSITYLQGLSNIRQPEDINLKQLSTRELENIQQERLYAQCKQLRKLFLTTNESGLPDKEFKQIDDEFSQIEQSVLNNDGLDDYSIETMLYILNGVFIAFVERRRHNKNASKVAEKLLDDVLNLYNDDDSLKK